MLQESTESNENDLVFVLVRIPFEKSLETAEKIKLKLPIEYNDLAKYNCKKSMWSRFESLQPEEIRKEYNRNFFTAPYNSNLRPK